jgi:hypothetical protein
MNHRKGAQQTAISAKIDHITFAWLEQEKNVTGTPRNRIINKAIVMYIRIMAARRRLKCEHHSREEIEKMAALILGIESFDMFADQ